MMRSSGLHLRGVDVMKLFMALCVVAIHIDSAPFVAVDWNAPVQWLIRLAVPFFFISSGFLLYRKFESESQVKSQREFLLKRAKKTFKVFLCWIALYLPVSIYVYLTNGHDFMHNFVRYIGQLLVSGDSQYAYPLWYLYSLSIVLAVFATLSRFKRADIFLFLFFALVVTVNWAGRKFAFPEPIGQLTDAFILLTSRTLGGGIFFMAGWMIASQRLSIPNYGTTLMILVLSVALFWFSLPFWELFGGIAVFLFALKVTNVPEAVAYRLRAMSMWVYFIHMYVIFAMVLICGDMQISIYVAYIIAASVSLVVALVLSRLSTLPSCRWLKFLVS